MKFVTWIIAVIPPLLATFAIAVDKADESEPLKELAPQAVNVTLACYGMCAIVLGAVTNHLDNETDGKIWALTFVGNLGGLCYLLLTPPFRDSPVWGELAQATCCILLAVSALTTGVLMFTAEPS